jgi:hypothetical protein
MGEWVSPKTILPKVVAPQPISSKGRFKRNFERGPGRKHKFKYAPVQGPRGRSLLRARAHHRNAVLLF